jgi:hypothetical protein
VYDSAGPRLRTLNKLRRAIETVDKPSILLGLRDAKILRKLNANYAESEIRAANEMLKLLDFDSLLNPMKNRRESIDSGAKDSMEGFNTIHQML